MRPAVETLVAELERDRVFGVDPDASRLWQWTPSELRRQVLAGLIDAESFWLRLERWLRATA
jgi:hypothetical protein